MTGIKVELGERSYEIIIDSGILNKIGEKISDLGFSSRIAVVSNPTVYGLYGKIVEESLKKAGFDVITVLIPDGEEYKDLLWVYSIYSELLKHRLDRSSALIALGGGVIGDITGFAASTYMRGISFIQVPTTLLAQVDSSVGGKTGVNHPLGKNMIGTFYQPRLVWADIDTLKTLEKKEVLAGLAEVIKYGIIWDAELFKFLKDNISRILNLDKEALGHIIKRSCEIKADVVSKDEREAGLRAILNYGHTIGHAIETATGYAKYLHGEAVAMGMVAEARLAVLLGLLDKAASDRINTLIDSYGLPTAAPKDIDKNTLLSLMQIDKKTIKGKLTFILPEKIGSVAIKKVDDIEKITGALSFDK